jgi:hypothetical protein
MRKPTLGISAIFTIICLIIPMAQILVVTANFIPAPAVEIMSPRPDFVRIYQNTTIPISIEVRVLNNSPEIASVKYSLDGEANVTLTNFVKSSQVYFAPNKQGFALTANSTLVNLSEGNHTLKAYSIYSNGEVMSTSSEFRIDSDYEPLRVELLSPQNQNYTDSQIPLIFHVNLEIKDAYYFLDLNASKHVSLYGNITLTGLSEGRHQIYLSVNSEDAHISNMTSFNINSTQPSIPILLTQMLPIIVAVVVLAVAFVSLLFYRRHRKAISQNKPNV